MTNETTKHPLWGELNDPSTTTGRLRAIHHGLAYTNGLDSYLFAALLRHPSLPHSLWRHYLMEGNPYLWGNPMTPLCMMDPPNGWEAKVFGGCSGYRTYIYSTRQMAALQQSWLRMTDGYLATAVRLDALIHSGDSLRQRLYNAIEDACLLYRAAAGEKADWRLVEQVEKSLYNAMTPEGELAPVFYQPPHADSSPLDRSFMAISVNIDEAVTREELLGLVYGFLTDLSKEGVLDLDSGASARMCRALKEQYPRIVPLFNPSRFTLID